MMVMRIDLQNWGNLDKSSDNPEFVSTAVLIEDGALDKLRELAGNKDLATIKSYNDYSLLQFAPTRSVADFLVKNGIDVNSKDCAGMTALHMACIQGRTSVVQYLLEQGANVNARSKSGLTPLIATTASFRNKKNKADIVEVLLSNGAQIDTQTNNGLNALEVALESKAYKSALHIIRHVSLKWISPTIVSK